MVTQDFTHNVMGGFGSAIAEALLDADILVPVKRFSVPDVLVNHAEPNESKTELGLTSTPRRK